MAKEVDSKVDKKGGISGANIASFINEGFDDIVQGVGTGINLVDKWNTSTANRMDERGNVTHKLTPGADALAGATALKEFGVFGMAAGAAGGFIGSLVSGNKQPTAQDQINEENKYQLGLQMQTQRAEDTFSQQQPIAEDGLDVSEAKQVEVERDELVLRKRGKSFSVAADFRGGKLHKHGGEQYTASEGDIIIPREKRTKVLNFIKHHRWSAIESVRQSLPTDKAVAKNGSKYEEGTKGVKAPAYNLTGLKAQNRIYARLVEAGLSENAAKGIVVNLSYESANFTATEELQANKHGTKGLGLAQWTNSKNAKRRDAFEAYLAENGKTVDDIDANVDFLISELKGEQDYDVGATIESFNKNSGTVEEASKHALIKFERPQDQSDKHNKKRIIGASKFLAQEDIATDVTPVKAPKGEPTIEDIVGIKDTYTEDDYKKFNNAVRKFKGKEEIDYAKIEAADKAKKIKENPGYYNRSTGKGKDIAEANKNQALKNPFKIENKDPLDKAMTFLGDIILDAGAKVSSSIVDRFKEREVNEVGFTDPKLATQADAFHALMESETSVWRRVLGEIEGVDALRNKILFGQSLEGSLPAATGNLMAGLEPAEVEKIISAAKKKGILDDMGANYVRNVYNKPEDWYTSQMSSGLTVDIASIVANPKGVLSAIRGLKKGVVGTAKGVKALFTPELWKGIKESMKKSPALARKLGNNLVEAFKTEYKYSGADDLDELAKVVDEAGASGAAVSKENLTWYQQAKKVVASTKNLPDKIRKSLTGNSFEDVRKMQDKVSKLTGKSFEELIKMPKSEVAKLVNSKVAASVDNVIEVKKAAAKAKDEYAAAKGAHNTLKEELKILQKGGADPIELAAHNKKISDAADALVDTEQGLVRSITKEKSIESEIYRLEEFMSDPLYRDKWRVVKQLDDGAKNQMKTLEKNDEFIKGLVTKYHMQEKTLGEIMEATPEVRKAILKTRASEIEMTAALKQAEAGRASKAANEKIMGAVWNETKMKELKAKFPKLMNALEKDADMLDRFKKGSITLANVAQYYADKPRDTPDESLASEIDTVIKEGDKEQTKADEVTPADDKGKRPVAKAVETTPSEATPIVETPKEATETPAGKEVNKGNKDTKDKIGVGESIGGVLDNLAQYAPAFYNIAKGMQPAEKAKRRFVTPQTKKYENMSQPQLNAIDAAFEASMGNARNLSGGMMGNFRANVEKSWAERIRRGSEVNAVEAGRADQVANDNINIRNNAEQFNQQVHAQADIQDMQSEAATNAFMAQGMQDLANISGVRRKDKAANKMQDNMLALASTGNYKIVPDGKGGYVSEFIGGSNKEVSYDKATNTLTKDGKDMEVVGGGEPNFNIGTPVGYKIGDKHPTTKKDLIPSFDFEDPSSEGFVQ